MVYRILILLFISCTLQAQFDGKHEGNVVRSGGKRIVVHASDIPPPSGQPPVVPAGTGAGVLLFYQDMDDMGVTAGRTVNSDSIDVLFGPNDNNGFGDNKGAIIDDGGGDHYLQRYMQTGQPGGSSFGTDIKKTMATNLGATDPALNNLTRVFVSWNARVESGFLTEVEGGKIFGGFRVGRWIETYDSDTDPWPVLDMGTNIRKGYNSSDPPFDRSQIYYYGMTNANGNVFNWPLTYQGGGNFTLTSSWRNYAYYMEFDPNPPDSVDCYLEQYVNEVLIARYDTFSLRMSDTLHLNYTLCGFFPGDTVTQAWEGDVDNYAIGYWTDGDSTWTGIEWKAYPDSALVRDFPGWPKGESEVGWGTFEFLGWWWLLILLPVTLRRKQITKYLKL